MLPEPLTSIYMEYRRDTATIATWLANTATQCGYRGGQTQPESEPPVQSRFYSTFTPISSTGNVLSLLDMVPMAVFIAINNWGRPVGTVPLSFTVAINRVIMVRRVVSRLFRKGEPPKQASDYLLGILKWVAMVLEPLMLPDTTTRQSPPERTPDSSTELETPRGRPKDPLEVLQLYELDDGYTNNSIELGLPVGSVKYEAEIQDDIGEAFFAFIALLRDASKLRQKVREL